MQDKLFFVQFMHPGGEHWTSGDTIPWNTEDHKRKCLVQRGRALRDGKISEGEIVFWGEWEPESLVVKHIPQPAHGYPHHLYSPYYSVPVRDKGQQNTDPFVFGDRFLYSCCRQLTPKGRPSQLQRLKVGSVLMFGSCIAKRFVLDTVFVVEHWVDFTLDRIAALLDRVPRVFADVTLSRLPSNVSGFKQPALPFRLYFGATIDHPRDGMYSFVPCMPFADAPKGFARPQIQIPTIITDKLSMGKKLNPVNNTATVRTLWDRVRARTLEMGLHLGVSAEAPPCCQASTPG